MYSTSRTLTSSLTLFLLFVLMIACNEQMGEQKTGKTEAKVDEKIVKTPESKLILSQDSGTITKREAIDFLVSSKLTDTTGPRWYLVGDNDTIGKYYKVKKLETIIYVS